MQDVTQNVYVCYLWIDLIIYLAQTHLSVLNTWLHKYMFSMLRWFWWCFLSPYFWPINKFDKRHFQPYTHTHTHHTLFSFWFNYMHYENKSNQIANKLKKLSNVCLVQTSQIDLSWSRLKKKPFFSEKQMIYNQMNNRTGWWRNVRSARHCGFLSSAEQSVFFFNPTWQHAAVLKACKSGSAKYLLSVQYGLTFTSAALMYITTRS